MSAEAYPNATASGFVAAACTQLKEPLRTDMTNSTAMKQVAQAWLATDADDAQQMVTKLISTINHLRHHGPSLVYSAKQREGWETEWHDRKQQAVRKLREAAELLKVNTPLEEPDRDRALRLWDAKTLELLGDMGHLDIVMRGIADAVEVANICPVGLLVPPRISADHVGARGGAANLASAINGVAVREIRCGLPSSLYDDYALITKLAALAGLDISRQNVRGILLRGHT